MGQLGLKRGAKADAKLASVVLLLRRWCLENLGALFGFRGWMFLGVLVPWGSPALLRSAADAKLGPRRRLFCEQDIIGGGPILLYSSAVWFLGLGPGRGRDPLISGSHKPAR